MSATRSPAFSLNTKVRQSCAAALCLLLLLAGSCSADADPAANLDAGLDAGADAARDAAPRDAAIADATADPGEPEVLDLAQHDHTGRTRLTSPTLSSMDFVRVAAQTFRQGSPGLPTPEAGRSTNEVQRDVTLRRDFFLQSEPVTQAQWRTVMGNNPSRFPACGDDCPQDSVNWFEAASFANELTKQEGLQACYSLSNCRGSAKSANLSCRGATFVGYKCTGYRMPTEAEWELAARAGSTDARYGTLADIAWYKANSTVTYTGGVDCSANFPGAAPASLFCATQPVGQKTPNALGLSDILGNTFEWTTEFNKNWTTAPATDPLNASYTASAILRSCSWNSPESKCRFAARTPAATKGRSNLYGFRLARTIPSPLADARYSKIEGTQRTLADGVSEATITIKLANFDNILLQNALPTFEASGAGNAYGTCTPSNAQGISTCTMTSTEVGEKTLRLTSPGSFDGQTITFRPPASAANSAIEGQDGVQADGRSIAAVLITLKDASGAALDAVTPTFEATGAGNAYQACQPTNAQGVAVCTMTSTQVGPKTLKLLKPVALDGPAITFVEPTSGNDARFVRIEAGTYTQGSPAGEAPSNVAATEIQREVTLTRDFEIQTTPVTQKQWKDVMGNNPSGFSSCGDDCPVERVSWYEAALYANELSKDEGRPACYVVTGCSGGAPGTTRHKCTGARLSAPTCSGYRLPTEAEWEYAARAGSTGPRYGELDAIAWYTANSAGRTQRVGQKPANAWELADAIGNVSEWTHDRFAKWTADAVTDPIGAAGTSMAVRSCAFNSLAPACRAAARRGLTPASRANSVGFRVARTILSTEPDARQSSIEGESGKFADGTSEAAITVTLRNADALGLPGIVPTLTASGSGNTLSPCAPTDTDGKSRCTLKTTVAGAKTLALSAPLVLAGPAITFRPAIDLAASTIEGDTGLWADGTSLAQIRVQLVDVAGDPVSGLLPVFEASGTGNTYVACSVGDADGRSTCGMRATVGGTKELRLTAPVAFTGESILFRAMPMAAMSTITGDTGVLADGTSVANVTITLRDTTGAGVEGVTPTFAASGEGRVPGLCSETDTTGTATCTLTATRPGPAILRVTAPIAYTGQTITFVAPISPTASRITGTSGIPADGTSTSTITITLVDIFGNPVPGQTPTFEATGAGNTPGPCSTTNAQGIATCTLASTAYGEKQLSVLTPVAFSGGAVTFLAVADPAMSSITGQSGVWANGTSPATVEITLRAADGTPISGVVPAFSASGMGNAYGLCTPTDMAGLSTCSMTSTVAEEKTLAIATPITLTGSTITFSDIPGLPPATFVRIPAGVFKRGAPSSETGRQPNEEPQHDVTITRPFYMLASEVTQGEWKAAFGINPATNLACGADCPVESVTWYDGAAYANHLSEAEGLQACYILEGCANRPGAYYHCTSVAFAGLDCPGYRLPTEAEWEYAARAGATAPLTAAALNAQAWHGATSGGKLQRVARKEPNAFGLFDMLGNVNEWTHDLVIPYAEGELFDPMGAATGTSRVTRNCSYQTPKADNCRFAYRVGLGPVTRQNALGFRIARTDPVALIPVAPDFSSITGQTGVVADGRSEAAITIVLKDARERAIVGLIPTFRASGDGNTYGRCSPTNADGQSNCQMTTIYPGDKTLELLTPAALTGDTITFVAQPHTPASFVTVDAGTYTQGSPSTETGRLTNEVQREVTLTRPFLMQETEVTQGQWTELMGHTLTQHPTCGPDCPQDSLTWYEAAAYANVLSRVEGREQCYELAGCTSEPGKSDYKCTGATFRGLECTGYRLPTDAEWEYAARAETTTARYGALRDIAWSLTSTTDGKPRPVAQKEANAWGLYDMLGNTQEYVHNWNGIYTTAAATDPEGPATGTNRGLRGCAANSADNLCRAAWRGQVGPNTRAILAGFRVVRTTQPAGPPSELYSSIAGTTDVLADGADTSLVTIVLKDADNSPVRGAVPTFEATGSGNGYGTCTPTDRSGVSTCTMTSTVAEVKVLSLTAPLTLAGGIVEFIDPNPSDANCTIVGESGKPADGTTVSLVTITLRNATGRGIPGLVPTFEATGGGKSYGACAPTNTSGISTCTLTSSEPGRTTLKLSAPVSVVGETIVFTPVDGWYGTGVAYACCDGASACSECEDQNYRVYTCVGLNCAFTTTGTRTEKSSCTSCDDGDSCTRDRCNVGICENSGSCGSGGMTPELVLIPAGTFVQEPDGAVSRTVTISRSFYLQNTEVTQGQWRALIGNNPSLFSDCGDDCPVERVNWYEALAYMNAASVRDGFASCYTLTGCTGVVGSGCGSTAFSSSCANNYICTGATFTGLSCPGYRLPTEAEWEYAARGGTTTQTYLGDLPGTDCAASLPLLGGVAWYSCNSNANVQRVGQKTPNAFGLYDMLGNTNEWMWDRHASFTSAAVTDPLGPGSGSTRVIRGGSWTNEAIDLAVSLRNASEPGMRHHVRGLRAARTHAPPAALTHSTITGENGKPANGTTPATITITLRDATNTGIAGLIPTFQATGAGNAYGLCTPTNASGVSTCTMTSSVAGAKTLQLTTPVAVEGQAIAFAPVDGWFAIGAASSCCDGGSVCRACEDQEYRTHTCTGTICSYTATGTRMSKSACLPCDDGISCTTDTCNAGMCENTNTCGGDYVIPRMMLVPAGTFVQGPSVVSRSVTVSRPFYIQNTELTQGQWRALMGNNPSSNSSCGADCPVEQVNWYEALAYLNTASLRDGHAACYALSGCSGTPGSNYTCQSANFNGLSCLGYRLPTEAEWEYAARGNTTTQTYAGNLSSSTCTSSMAILDGIAWYSCNNGTRTLRVGQKQPNGYGLYDMLGSVAEWTGDWYGVYTSTSVTDPFGPATGALRMTRGGSFASAAADIVVANRTSAPLVTKRSSLGFRPARSTSSAGPATATPSPAHSTITGENGIPANGTTPATITIALRDATNTAIANIIPTFEATGRGNAYGACTTTNAQGIATCSMTSTVAGSKTLKIAFPVVKQGEPIAFAPVEGWPKMVLIPAGNYQQGPWGSVARTVTISRPFYLQNTELTQGQWRALMGNNPSSHSTCGTDCPVEQVNWFDALAYLNAASVRDRYDTCYALSGCSGRPGEGNYTCKAAVFKGLSCPGYRLPTEAEWEYAARAGSTTQTYAGNIASADCAWSTSVLDGIAWYACNNGYRTMPVAQRKPNAYGVYDMLGNVSEWTFDWYTSYTSANATDPFGNITGAMRMRRGGDFGASASELVVSARHETRPELSQRTIGFRAARSSSSAGPTTPAPSPAHSTITGESGMPANGTTPATITITLRNDANTGIANIIPTFEATGSGNTYGACTTTNAQGISTCSMTSTVIGPKTLKVTSPVVTQGATIDFAHLDTWPQMALIPAGTYVQGPSESGSRTVTITRSFYVQNTEITQAQWRALMGNNPSSHSTCGTDCPVEQVNWYESLRFLNAASTRDGYAACYTLNGCSGTPGTRNGYACKSVSFSGLDCPGYRLPTDAEWEYAARGNTTTRTYGGDLSGTACTSTMPVLDRIAWYYCNGAYNTMPAAHRRPNAYGLYDMLGNVSEWTWDWYTPYTNTSAIDPFGQPRGVLRTLRGHSFAGSENGFTVVTRQLADPRGHSSSVGFRAARSVPATPAAISPAPRYSLISGENGKPANGTTPANITITLRDDANNGIANIIPTFDASGSGNGYGNCTTSDAQGLSTCAMTSTVVGPQTLKITSPVALEGNVIAFSALDGWPQMVLVPAGTFRQGPSGGMSRTVTISQPFYIQNTEVTQGQWRSLIANNPSSNATCGTDCPVDRVTWWEALKYLNAASARDGHAPCYLMSGCSGTLGGGSGYTCTGVAFSGLDCPGYRLPTETEWEYAARAGTTSNTYAGNLNTTNCPQSLPTLDKIAWYACNNGLRTMPVAQRQPNANGLYDTLGNASEWTWDWHTPFTGESVTDPVSPFAIFGRTMRGGSFESHPSDVTGTYRSGIDPSVRGAGLGFRPVQSVSTASPSSPIPSPAHSTITGDTGKPADGTTPAAIAITLRDDTNTPIPGLRPTFHATGTGNAYADCTETDAQGISRCSMTSTNAGSQNLWITSPILALGATISFSPASATPVVVPPEMLLIPSGTFEQGPFGSVSRTVTISNPFYLQNTEVTQGQWRALFSNSPSAHSSCGTDCPLEQVSWYDALAYLNAASTRDGYEPCYALTRCSGTPGSNYTCTGTVFSGLACSGYRLPTEAEWEYAARGRMTTQTYNGNLLGTTCTSSSHALDSIAWYQCNSGYRTRTAGQKSPNAYGLYDMLGNVSEWTQDWYALYTSVAVTDPFGPTTGALRTLRGGSYRSSADGLVAANRIGSDPGTRDNHTGFRPARSAAGVTARPSPTNSTITGESGTPADGSTPAAITITLRDDANNGIAGRIPTFEATGDINTYGPCTPTNAEGVSTCTMLSGSPGPKTLKLVWPIVVEGPTIAFAPIDGWYSRSATYACCDGTSACLSCEEQEYRAHTCVGATCSYTVTGTRTAKSQCTSCDDGDSCTVDTCSLGACQNSGSCAGGSP